MKASGVAILTAFIACGGIAIGEMRTWSNVSGKFKVDAELLSQDAETVQLRSAEGKELSVPLSKLSASDRRYLKSLVEIDETVTSEAKGDNPTKQLRELAETFYRDLRTKDRNAARETLTEAAQAWAKEGKSPLSELPTPDKARSAVKAGKPVIDGDKATVPVQVRIAGKAQDTKLHLRKEDEKWRVVALSADVAGEEKSISLEPTEAVAGAAAVVPEPPSDPLAALVGKPLELAGVTLDGTAINLDQFKGKVVLIDFWATWCGPCRAEIPNIRANWDKYHEAGFEVIALSVDQDLEALKKFVTEENPPWTVVADFHPQNKNGSAAQKFGIQGIPAFILVGKDGNVAAVHCRGQRLEMELARLLGDK